MRIKTKRGQYVMIFYDGKHAPTFDTKEGTMELPILSRDELEEVRRNIDEIIAKEDNQ